MRDLALNSTIPPIEYVSGYYVYKAGQSVLKFVNDTYGKKKLTEFYHSMKKTKRYVWTSNQTFHDGFIPAVVFTYIPKCVQD